MLLPTDLPTRTDLADGTMALTQGLYDLFSQIPASSELVSAQPLARSRELAQAACLKAAAISGALALPPGPLGLLTVLPDLMTIWKLQQQLVADIAATHGKTGALRPELMIYCLFRHGAAVFVRDLVVRVGERVLVKRAALRLMREILQKIGLRVTQRLIGKTLSRWLPVVGAAGVGAYSYYDTSRVAATAIETFSRVVEVEAETETLPTVFPE